MIPYACSIVWHDAAHHGPGEWVDVRDLDPRCWVVTVGMLIAKRRGYHIVAQSVEGPHYAGVFSIPDAAIRSVHRLR